MSLLAGVVDLIRLLSSLLHSVGTTAMDESRVGWIDGWGWADELPIESQGFIYRRSFSWGHGKTSSWGWG